MDLQSDKNQETIILGRISGHYGVKGWVKIFSYTKPIEGILSYSECYIDGVNTFKSGRILEGRKQGKLIIVKLSGVNDRDTAEDYIGLNLILPADSLPKLDDGHYYWRELEGLSVVDMQSKKLEEINKYLNSPKRLLEKRRDLDEQRKRDAVERSKNLSNSGKTISKDWQSSYEHAHKGSKKKTTKRRL